MLLVAACCCLLLIVADCCCLLLNPFIEDLEKRRVQHAKDQQDAAAGNPTSSVLHLHLAQKLYSEGSEQTDMRETSAVR